MADRRRPAWATWQIVGATGALIGVAVAPSARSADAPPTGAKPAKKSASGASASRPVLLVLDPQRGPLKTLKDAFAACKPSDDVVIEIRTNGVLRTTGLKVSARNLVLRAGKGYQPLIYRPPRRSASEPTYMLSISATRSLVVEGLHFVCRGVQQVTGLVVRGASVKVVGCTFRHGRAQGLYGIQALEPTRELVVSGSLFANFSHVVMLSTNSGHVVISQCALAHWYALLALDSSRLRHGLPSQFGVRLEHNTMVGGFTLFLFSCGSEGTTVPRRVEVDMARNVVTGWADQALRAFATFKISCRDGEREFGRWRQAVRWRGRLNVMGPCAQVVRTIQLPSGAKPVEKAVFKDVPSFLRHWAPNLKKPWDGRKVSVYKKGDVAWHGWGREHFKRVHRWLPVKIGNVGADLARLPDVPDVPPAAEAPVSVPAAAASPPEIRIVDPVRGPYRSLAAAFQEGSKAPLIIELHGNGPFPAENLVRHSRSRVTVRAGKDDAPVIQLRAGHRASAMIKIGDSSNAAIEAVFEGLHFVMLGKANTVLQPNARTVRIRRCTFRQGPRGDPVPAVDLTQAVRHAEVTECVFCGFGSALRVAESKQITLENNLVLGTGHLLRIEAIAAAYAPDAQVVLRTQRNTVAVADAVLRFAHTSAERRAPARVEVKMAGDVFMPARRRAAAFIAITGQVAPDQCREAPWRERIQYEGHRGVIGGFDAFVRLDPTEGSPSVLCGSSHQFRTGWGPGLKDMLFTRRVWPSTGRGGTPWHAYDTRRLQRAYRLLPSYVGRRYGADLKRLPTLLPIRMRTRR